MIEKTRILKFTDLIVWREAHKLVLLVYKISEKFPEKEKFGLTNQIRRASVSITSNIAEGFARYSVKDKKHFYIMSKASLSEVENQLIIAHDLGFINDQDNLTLVNQSEIVGRLLTGFVKSTSNL